MRDDLVLGGALHRGEAEQPGVIADAARDAGFRDRLPRRAGKACDQRQRPLGPVRRGLGRELQHRPVQADVADRELRGVDADREAAGAGVDVIARQRALMLCRAGGSASSASGCAGSTVPSAISLPISDLIWLWCMAAPYPNSGPATANGSSCGPCGRAAEPHALERPLDASSRRPVSPSGNSSCAATASISSGPVSHRDDRIDQRQRVARRGRQTAARYGARCGRRGPARWHRSLEISREPRTPANAEQQGACDRSPWRGGRAR